MICISTITDSGKLYNLHSHTQFCDGRASMESFVVEAIHKGFKHYGFSPHSPVPFPSPCNMAASDVPVYLGEVERLRNAYGDKINLYSSMEVDYLGDDWNVKTPFIQSIPLDYTISSVHFVPCGDSFVDIDGCFENFRKKMSVFFSDDIRLVVRLFYEQSMRMVETGGFDIIGHFDKIGHNASLFSDGIEDEPFYIALVNELIDMIIEKGIIVEINTKAFDRATRFFPSKRYWKRLINAKVPIVINSDCHYPNLVDAGRAEAIAEYEEMVGGILTIR